MVPNLQVVPNVIIPIKLHGRRMRVKALSSEMYSFLTKIYSQYLGIILTLNI